MHLENTPWAALITPPRGTSADPGGSTSAGTVLHGTVPDGTVALPLDLARVGRWLWATVTVLVVLDVLASAATTVGVPYQLTRFFDGDEKTNVPTGYKVSMLLAATVLCAVLAAVGRRQGDPFTPGWRLLTWVSGFAFVDESIYLHQSISAITHKALHTDGILTYAWVLIYAPLAFVVGVRLLMLLPRLALPARWTVTLGGAVYLFGSLGLEPVKSKISDSFGDTTLMFKLTASVSDSLEMIGLTLLVVALMSQLRRTVRAVVAVV